MNYYTSKDEAMKLAKIVSTDTADMSYVNGEPCIEPYKDEYKDMEEISPCWSAGRVMQLLPSVVEDKGVEYHPHWEKTVVWMLYYQNSKGNANLFKIGDLIEICIAMLEDLKEGGLL